MLSFFLLKRSPGVPAGEVWHKVSKRQILSNAKTFAVQCAERQEFFLALCPCQVVFLVSPIFVTPKLIFGQLFSYQFYFSYHSFFFLNKQALVFIQPRKKKTTQNYKGFKETAMHAHVILFSPQPNSALRSVYLRYAVPIFGH